MHDELLTKFFKIFDRFHIMAAIKFFAKLCIILFGEVRFCCKLLFENRHRIGHHGERKPRLRPVNAARGLQMLPLPRFFIGGVNRVYRVYAPHEPGLRLAWTISFEILTINHTKRKPERKLPLGLYNIKSIDQRCGPVYAPRKIAAPCNLILGPRRPSGYSHSII